MSLLFFALFSAVLASSAPLFSQQVSADKIMKKLDTMYRADSSYSEIEMNVVTPNWERTLRANAWSEGMEKTFIRITYPPRERGMATLRIGNQMWNFLPRIAKTIKIPPAMMMGSWMGSDFTNDDLVRESTFLNDYTYSIITPQAAEDGLIYLELIPKEGVPVVWGRVVVSVRASDYIPVRQEYFDEKGALMRVMTFSDMKDFGGRKIPSVIEVVPQNREGHKTVIRYINLRLNESLPDGTFSIRNLRRTK